MKAEELLEGLSPVLYHYTMLQSAIKILERNAFRLTAITGVERRLGPEKHLYFLSTSRHRLGGYHVDTLHVGMPSVLFRLDGRKLSQKYPGAAIDYWGGFQGEPHRKEAEDRIFHNKPYIENAASYIDRIDIRLSDKEDDRQKYVSMVLRLMLLAKQNGITAYAYKSHKDWLAGNRNKAVKLDDLRKMRGAPKEPKPKYGLIVGREPEFKPYLRLLLGPVTDSKNLSSGAQLIRRRLWYPHDFVSQFEISAHNHKRTPGESGYHKLLQVMRRLGIKNAEELWKYLKEKWMPES